MVHGFIIVMESGLGLVRWGNIVKIDLKSYRQLIICIVVLLILSLFCVNSYAGNNDSLPIYGYIGQGAATGWEYTRHHSGMQI